MATKWGYAKSGGRRHITQIADGPARPGERCCNPSSIRRCCGFSGTAICGAALIGEISDKNLPYWVPCQHCLNRQRPCEPCQCGADCDQADDTCHGEVDVVDEDMDGNWLHSCTKHQGGE